VTVLEIVETVLLALALVYIVALLRSHADILRRLSVLEDAVDQRPAPADPSRPSALRVAADLSGAALDGSPAAIALRAGSPPALLAFLTSGCSFCGPWWSDLGDADRRRALGTRVVIVTHDRSRESVGRLREQAPAGVELVMSTAAWRTYEVPASPHFVLCDGQGGIAGRGSALSWAQLTDLIGDALAHRVADADEARPRTTSERAARAERALMQSGIGPGHPSLHPAGPTPPSGASTSH
jgi:hypothetical protein